MGSRGITNFMEHCRGLRHHRLDCVIRLHRGLPLRRRDGTLMTNEESAECRVNLGGVTVPFIETCPSLSVLEVLELEGGWAASVGGRRRGRRLARKDCALVCMLRGRRSVPRLSI